MLKKTNSLINGPVTTDATTDTNMNTTNDFDSFKSDEESNNLNESKDVTEGVSVGAVAEEIDYAIHSWDELDISSELLRGIYSAGFEKPSPIQKKAIKPILLGKDIIAQAQSGTGKTATFTIGALSKVDIKAEDLQILVLSPTRELSTQTEEVFIKIGSMMRGLKIKTLVGGTYVDDDIRSIKANMPHIITGCPGRVCDIMRRMSLGKTIKLVILDEADELLSYGFKEQVYNIFQMFNTNVQVALFSATMPVGLNTITDKFMRSPVNIIVKAEQLTLEGISQFFVAVEDDAQKFSTLKDIYKFIAVSQCIIYCNSVKRVEDLYDAMVLDKFAVCCIHSNMAKPDRDHAFSEFKNGKYRVLISSNVTARGIDIQQVSTVINFDVPKCVHTYLHRIGRSGRWGRKGVGLNLITQRDLQKIREIEAFYHSQINEMPGNIAELLV